MKVIIRTDSSFNIGTGHVSRCLALAQKLRDQGKIVSFACRLLEGNVIGLIEEKQFKVIKLSPPKTTLSSKETYESWRGVSLGEEIVEFSKIVTDEEPEWVIVDHYSLPIEWEKRISELGPKIFAIDDLYRNHECEALLDQNALLSSSEYQKLIPKNARLFLGPQYALLASSFIAQIPPKRKFSKVSNILAFFGGSDLTDETLKLIRYLTGNLEEFHFDIVVGKINKSLNDISELCKKETRFSLHIQTPHMAKLMEKADLFIGAGGTTTWERCYMGVPSICITTAENQVQIAKDLDLMQIHQYLGHWDQIKREDVLNSLTLLISDHERKRKFSENSLNLRVGSKVSDIFQCFN